MSSCSCRPFQLPIQMNLQLYVLFSVENVFKNVATSNHNDQVNWSLWYNLMTLQRKLYFLPKYLHSIDEHACKSKRYFFGKLFPGHRHLKAITEVDVDDFTTHSIQH